MPRSRGPRLGRRRRGPVRAALRGRGRGRAVLPRAQATPAGAPGDRRSGSRPARLGRPRRDRERRRHALQYRLAQAGRSRCRRVRPRQGARRVSPARAAVPAGSPGRDHAALQGGGRPARALRRGRGGVARPAAGAAVLGGIPPARPPGGADRRAPAARERHLFAAAAAGGPAAAGVPGLAVQHPGRSAPRARGPPLRGGALRQPALRHAGRGFRPRPLPPRGGAAPASRQPLQRPAHRRAEGGAGRRRGARTPRRSGAAVTLPMVRHAAGPRRRVGSRRSRRCG